MNHDDLGMNDAYFDALGELVESSPIPNPTMKHHRCFPPNNPLDEEIDALLEDTGGPSGKLIGILMVLAVGIIALIAWAWPFGL